MDLNENESVNCEELLAELESRKKTRPNLWNRFFEKYEHLARLENTQTDTDEEDVLENTLKLWCNESNSTNYEKTLDLRSDEEKKLNKNQASVNKNAVKGTATRNKARRKKHTSFLLESEESLERRDADGNSLLRSRTKPGRSTDAKKIVRKKKESTKLSLKSLEGETEEELPKNKPRSKPKLSKRTEQSKNEAAKENANNIEKSSGSTKGDKVDVSKGKSKRMTKSKSAKYVTENAIEVEETEKFYKTEMDKNKPVKPGKHFDKTSGRVKVKENRKSGNLNVLNPLNDENAGEELPKSKAKPSKRRDGQSSHFQSRDRANLKETRKVLKCDYLPNNSRVCYIRLERLLIGQLGPTTEVKGYLQDNDKNEDVSQSSANPPARKSADARKDAEAQGNDKNEDVGQGSANPPATKSADARKDAEAAQEPKHKGTNVKCNLSKNYVEDTLSTTFEAKKRKHPQQSTSIIGISSTGDSITVKSSENSTLSTTFEAEKRKCPQQSASIISISSTEDSITKKSSENSATSRVDPELRRIISFIENDPKIDLKVAVQKRRVHLELAQANKNNKFKYWHNRVTSALCSLRQKLSFEEIQCYMEWCLKKDSF